MMTRPNIIKIIQSLFHLVNNLGLCNRKPPTSKTRKIKIFTVSLSNFKLFVPNHCVQLSIHRHFFQTDHS